jgi:succinyl-diaminopimelate desuccinylase
VGGLVAEDVLEYSIGLLKRLISIPTVAPQGEHYGEAAELLARELEALGFHVDVIKVPASYQESNCRHASREPRFIVYARSGTGGGPVVHFNGHYDVVPGGPGWEVTEPFKPVISNGRLYGRGAIDMKGGIAAVLGSLKANKDRIPSYPFSVEAAFVPDEEIGGDCGTGYLTRVVLEGRSPDYVLIPEPRGLKNPWHGHKGAVWVRVRVKGRTAHGSTHWLGRNAFLEASLVALELQSLMASRLAGKRSKYRVVPEEASRPTAMIGGVAGVVGGGKTNQVPGEFEFSIDRRLIPEEDAGLVYEEIADMVRMSSIKYGAEARVDAELLMNPAINEPGVLYEALREAARRAGISVEEPVVCPGGLDMWYYTTRGSRALAYGPSGELAHAPDEYIDLGELRSLIAVYSLTLDLLGPMIENRGRT